MATFPVWVLSILSAEAAEISITKTKAPQSFMRYKWSFLGRKQADPGVGSVN